MKKLFIITVLAVLAMSVSSCKENKKSQIEDLSAITIDGDFKDWDAAVAEAKATRAYLDATHTYAYTALKQFAVYVHANEIYFMVKYDPTKTQPMDIFFATKGEIPTDAINLWNPCYVDYCIEFGKGDTFVEDPADIDWSDWNYQQLMAYDHQKGGWNWTMLGQNMVTISQKVDMGSEKMVEGKLSASNFTFSQKYFYIGAFTSNGSWATTGAQPTATIKDEELVLPEMLKITLP